MQNHPLASFKAGQYHNGARLLYFGGYFWISTSIPGIGGQLRRVTGSWRPSGLTADNTAETIQLHLEFHDAR